MSYLKTLRQHPNVFENYLQIRSWLKNYFYDLKVNTASSKKISFKRAEAKIRYVITGSIKRPSFQIIEANEIVKRFTLTKQNLKAIKQAIFETAPEGLSEQCMTFNARLSNTFTRERFDEAYLRNMANWKSRVLDDTDLTQQVDETYVYKGDSKSEMRILNYLLKYDCVKLLRGQDYAIQYENKNYYPDFVYLNHMNQLVVLEVKGKGDFSTEKNLKKYFALVKHCTEKGYVFGMVDANFNTLNSLLEVPVHKGFEKALLTALKKDGVVNSQTITKLRVKEFSHLKRKAIQHMITKIVIKNRLVNRPKSVHDLNIHNEKSKLKDYYLITSASKRLK